MTYGLPGAMTHRAFILPSIIHSVHSKLISPSSVPSTMTLTQMSSSIGISSTSLATSSRMSHFYDNMEPHPLSPFVIRSQVVHRESRHCRTCCDLLDPFSTCSCTVFTGTTYVPCLLNPECITNMVRLSSEYEVAQVEEHELTAGPLSLLQTATRTHTQVLISCRNNRKLV